MWAAPTGNSWSRVTHFFSHRFADDYRYLTLTANFPIIITQFEVQYFDQTQQTLFFDTIWNQYKF